MAARQRQRALMDIRDLKAWCEANSTAFEMVEDDDGLLTCNVTLTGPEDTPYAGGNFVACIQLPKTFPMKSPSVAFKTRVWHPNVEKISGSVCLDVLQDRWTPITRLTSVVETYLPELLRHPNMDDPLNGAAAAMMRDNHREYSDYVRLYTRKHAMAEEGVELPDISRAYDFEYGVELMDSDEEM